MVAYINRAVSLAAMFGITTTQGLSYLFDMAVNSYSFTDTDTDSAVKKEFNKRAEIYFLDNGVEMPDYDRLFVLNEYDRNPARREVIYKGFGNYLGHNYNISTYRLDYNTTF